MRLDSAARWGLAALLFLATTGTARAQVVEYYHEDGIGSVRVVTNGSGLEAERHDYLPFGEDWNPAANPQPRQFTGKERDAETGLDYFGARYYGSRLGRFTTVDPACKRDANLVDPQRWNRYAYALNRPLRSIDPDGRDTWDLVIGFGQGIGSVALGVVTAPVAFVAHPVNTVKGAIRSAGDTLGALNYAAHNPGEVVDQYVRMSTSNNDADQRALGTAFGQGTAVAALTLAPTAKGPAAKTFLPDEYYLAKLEGKAPGQGAPFGTYERFDAAGNLKQVTTYDEFGSRIRQYDIGPTARHGEGVHTFEYSASSPRQVPGGGIRSEQVPLNQFGTNQ